MLRKRTAGAVTVFAGLYLMLYELSGVLGPDLRSTRDTESLVIWLVSAFAGAWVARSRFILPAVATWALLWVASVALLYQIAAGAGQGSVVGILEYNAMRIGLSLLAVLLGVAGGQYIASRGGRRQPVAA